MAAILELFPTIKKEFFDTVKKERVSRHKKRTLMIGHSHDAFPNGFSHTTRRERFELIGGI
jgi:hypothetical protein